ncbi:MAG: zinc metallopeptidase [Oscillospiraceae bacterium]
MNSMVMLLSSAAHGSRFAGNFTLSYSTAYLLCIAAFIFSVICSVRVNSTFKKYSRTSSAMGITAAEAARRILDANGLSHIRIERIAGNLTDHFDPRSNVIALSDSVYGSTSMAAIGVAAHECGHAVQHSQGYIPIKIRTAIVPLVNFGSMTYIYVFLAGILFNFGFLIDLGIILFAFVVVFQLVTLPVEFNASSRALRSLKSMGILGAQEIPAARKTLSAAAMTYVAGLAVSLTQLLRLIASTRSRRR